LEKENYHFDLGNIKQSIEDLEFELQYIICAYLSTEIMLHFTYYATPEDYSCPSWETERKLAAEMSEYSHSILLLMRKDPLLETEWTDLGVIPLFMHYVLDISMKELEIPQLNIEKFKEYVFNGDYFEIPVKLAKFVMELRIHPYSTDRKPDITLMKVAFLHSTRDLPIYKGLPRSININNTPNTFYSPLTETKRENH
jgi:hypothetical protein